MSGFENGFYKTVNLIEQAIFYFVSALIIIVSTIVCVELVSRNLFGHSFVMVEELCMILLGWISFFSAAYAMKRRGHVAVDFLFAKLNINVKKLLYALTYIGGIVFMLYIVRSSWEFSQMQMKVPLTLSRIPRGWIYLGLPFGGSFMVFFMLTDLLETFVLKKPYSLKTSVELTVEAIEHDDA